MGSQIEINDTLVISKDVGFPEILDVERHRHLPIPLEEIANADFDFRKEGNRIYHNNIRVFLVEEIAGKWIYWGHCLITSQTIENGKTFGKYKIIKLYDPFYQIEMTKNESPDGKSYF